MDIKSKLLDKIKSRKTKDFTQSEEFKEAVRIEAERLLDEHLSKLDDTFFEEINKMMTPITMKEESIGKEIEDKGSIEDQVNAILNQGDN